MSDPRIAVCYINNTYPTTYWDLQGVQKIHARPELWWSSRERMAFDGGLPTYEYLELDYGRLRSLNFLNFNILQKPINITIEYDVWAFESGVKYWQPVTKITDERFDDRVNYSPNSVNPWKNCQFYFTNIKGDLLSTRYLRIKFARRSEPWPNGDVADTFPWSVDVKDLRTSRYVISLNDTRGVLVQQGKVTSPIVDPVHYEDVADVTVIGIPSGVDVFHGATSDAGTALVVGVPSGADIQTQSIAADGETYFAFYATNDNTGILAATDGDGGMIANVNGNGNEGSAGTLRAGDYTDTNEVGHVSTDLPGFGIDYAFFTTPPDPTHTMCWTVAVGTAASAGTHTTSLFDYGRAISAGSSTVSHTNNFTAPLANYVMTYAIMVGGGATIADDSLLLGGGWTLQFTTTTDPTTNFTLYFYTRVALAGTGGNYVYPNVTLSGSAKWMAAFSYLGSPSDPTGTAYLIDSGQPVTDPTPAALTHGFRFESTIHGSGAIVVGETSDSATAHVTGVASGTDVRDAVDAATVPMTGTPSDPGDDYTPGRSFGDDENYVAFLFTGHDNAFQNQPTYTTGLFTATSSGGGAAVNFTVKGNSRMNNPPNNSDTTVAAYQDANAGHFVTDLPWIQRTYSDGNWENGAIIIRVGDGDHGPNAASGTTAFADVTQVIDQAGPGLDGISVDVSSLNSTDLCFFFICQNTSSFIDVPTSGLTQLIDYDDFDIGVHVAVWVGLRGAHTTFLANFDTNDVGCTAIVTAITQPGVWTSTRYAVLDSGDTTFVGGSNRFTVASHPEV